MKPLLAGLVVFAAGIFSAGFAAHAASFDCNKAATPTEKAICADKTLSALDEQLTHAYKQALTRAGDSPAKLRAGQRAWLKDLSNECRNGIDCLKGRYTERIKELDNTSVALATGTTYTGSKFNIGNASKQYDFVLRMRDKCDPPTQADDGTCEGPGQVQIYAKGGKSPLQTINMDNIYVSFSKSKQPLTNSAAMYDYQGVINVGDFNFDGQEDIAIQNGNNGSYSGPSYDVYLFSTKTKKFEYNDSFSSLIESTLGFFQVDPKRKRLATMAKDGCCYHEFTEYAVVNNEPVAVARRIEDMRNGDGDTVVVTEETLVNGKWKSKTKRVKQ
ncbi:lysozyme inhibitor LprI family protein [Andreprevotia chitinilytica]|uniref:lysozyme inhibitor LprI family protein n=1 Tax=Andreprevotia chitinilytica TaxID=396808 RepID=UPI0014701647|nr:lysozyme inhibitor LprI family protein [Andreprevotia chitinilytica]